MQPQPVCSGPFLFRSWRLLARLGCAGLLASTGVAEAAFKDITSSTPFATLEQLPIEQMGPVARDVARGGAPAIIDFDGDGWLDVYVTRFGLPDILFRNRSGSFERIDDPLGLQIADGGNCPAWADFDNDGDLDLFVATVGEKQHRLYLNEGNGRFREVAAERGVDLLAAKDHMGSGVAVGDLNRDGYLDIVVGEWGVTTDATSRYQHFAIFLNRGAEAPGYFDNITQRSGVVFGPGMLSIYAPNISDLDGDGWPDLPIVADFERSRLFWNNGDGTFSDGTVAAGVSKEENGMGTAIADVDGDGLLDWLVTSIRFTGYPGYRGNQLYINQGERRFESISEAAGVATAGWGWGCELFDFDNDGDLDIVVTNGTDNPSGNDQNDLSNMAPMLLWENRGGGVFVDVSDIQGVNHAANGAGLVAFDYDRDGDLDLLVFHQYSAPILLRNDRVAPNSWLRIGLQGIASNRDGIGARVSLQVVEDGPKQVREYNPTNTYLAQKEPYLHFGLGAGVERVHLVEIQWPSGAVDTLKDVEANVALQIIESSGAGLDNVKPSFARQPGKTLLRPGETLRLEIEVEGLPEPAIRWYRNAQLIPDANGPILEIPNVTWEDAGKYYATASNVAGVAYSEHARVSVRSLHLDKSVARQWMEELLEAIRIDYPAPTVHSRNLFGLSAAMWDAWVAYEEAGSASPLLSREMPPIPSDPAARERAREEAISFAAYRLLQSRFRLSPGAEATLPALRDRMELLGYDPSDKRITGDSPAAVGNRIAAAMLAFTWTDGGNEANGYVDQSGYQTVNEPLIFELPGATPQDPNRWQPLSFDHLVLQNGIVVGEAIQTFLGANWGDVRPFALERPSKQDVYSDPGPPPFLGGEGDQEYKDAALQIIEYSSWLDPVDQVEIDVSPGARHNNPLGSNDGLGYEVNPATGKPYEPNIVLRADYGRVLAEFWADGPSSETPPGHWNSVANYVADHPLFERRFEGGEDELGPLEWDVKLYFAINGAVYDAAIACWDAKRKYDYVRPITMIRYMGGKGQSSDPDGPAYHVEGLPLKEGLVEVVTQESSAPGERHAHLAAHIGEIAIRAWRGVPENVNTNYGGVGWMRAVEWMPYQRDTFVSPPFAGYTSGHSTFSRAAAEVLAAMTGSAFFPGGISSFSAGANEFLEFERGPERALSLTWATYYDAADEAGLSRLYGGIHVWPDDLRGRVMGSAVGKAAFAKAKRYFEGRAETADWDQALADWAAARSEQSNGPLDPNAVLEDPFGALARYYFGAEPLGAQSYARQLSILRAPDGRPTGLEFVMSEALQEPTLWLQCSTDLREWIELPQSACETQREAIGDELLRVSIRAKPDALPSDARFLRVSVREKH